MYVHIECETWYIDSIPLAFTRTHTHTHTRRVTNAPTYTHTHNHTDTFAAVTRATTFVRFRSNIVWYTNLFEFHSFSNLQFGPFQFLPHGFFLGNCNYCFSLLVVLFYNGCRRDFRLFLSYIYTYTHTRTEPSTHTFIWNDPLSSGKERKQLLMLLRKYLTAVMYVLYVIMVDDFKRRLHCYLCVLILMCFTYATLSLSRTLSQHTHTHTVS